jgi:hypothetical protein
LITGGILIDNKQQRCLKDGSDGHALLLMSNRRVLEPNTTDAAGKKQRTDERVQASGYTETNFRQLRRKLSD